jgi:ketosteroid isomerase-like protein
MLAKTPQEAIGFADEAFNRHDVDGVLDFYEEGAIMVYEPGRLAMGREALRGVYENFLNEDVIAKQEKINVVEAGDIALWTSKWSVSGTAKDGTPFNRGGVGSAVLRRHSDGGWRVVVENPWGPAVLD